jgi:hypothetical protein
VAKVAVKKTRVPKQTMASTRTRAVKDHSPKWEGCEEWTADQFHKHFRYAMEYYRLEADSKQFKPSVIKWMSLNGYTDQQIKTAKALKDHRFNSTIGAIAECLMRGMTPVREDFNGGKSSVVWLGNSISKIFEDGRYDIEPEEVEKKTVAQPSIQDRLREAAARMTDELEDAYEAFQINPDTFDPKAFKVLNLLKGKGAKAAHARIIKSFYISDLEELTEAVVGKDEQLKEGYSHRTKAQLKKLLAFLQEIDGACTMLMQEAKVERKPRAKKAKPVEKIVEKLKYKKSDEPLKLVSINPTDIVGASELWIYNIKTRKIGRYVAANIDPKGMARDGTGLSVKGTSIVGFNENASVQKTLRKPQEQLAEFKAAGKVALRKFLDDIKAVDIKLNGRINEETVLLKVQ